MAHLGGTQTRSACAVGAVLFLGALGCAGGSAVSHRPQALADGGTTGCVFDVELREARGLLDTGRHPAAESTAARLVVPGPTIADSARIANALDLLAEAMISGGRYWEPAASQAIERAFAIRHRDPGPDSLALAGSLTQLGRLRGARWNAKGAIEVYQRALELRERILGPEHPQVLAVMRAIAVERMQLHDRPGADSMLERCGAILARAVPPDDPARIENDLLLAHLRDRVSDTTRFASVIERTERVFGPDHPLLAERLSMYSERQRSAGHFARGHQLMTRAHGIYQRALGGRNLLTAKTWNLIGVNHIWSGVHDLALPYFEQSYATIRDLVGPEHVEIIKPSLDLGDLRCKMGSEATGLPLMERAVEIASRELPPEHWLAGLSLYLLGGAYATGGRADEARPILERLLALRQRTYPAGAEEIGRAMDLLAQTGGDPKRMRELYEGAARIYLEAYGPDHPLGARGMSLQSIYRFTDGDTAGALQLADSAIAVLTRTKGSANLDVAWGHVTIARMYRSCDRHEDAARSFERAAKAFASSTGAENMLTAMALRDLGEELATLNRHRDAFRAARQAEDARRAHLRHNARFMPESKALALMGSWSSARATGLNAMLSLAAATHDPEFLRLAWDGLIRSRAMVFDEMGLRHRTWSADADPEVQRLAARFDSTSRRVSRLEVAGLDPARPAESRARLEQARADRDRAERLLAERSQRFRGERARDRQGLDSVTAVLPPGSALVAYARYQPVERRGAAFVSPPSYLAFVTRGTETPAVVQLGPEHSLRSRIEQWRHEMQSEVVAGGGREAEHRYRRIGEELRQAIWDPVAAHLGEARRVFVVPDGQIGLVNFATLPVGATGFLVERGPTIHALSTERDLIRGAESASAPGGLLAIGAPAFDAAPSGDQAPPGPAGVSSGYRGPRTECVAFQDVRFGSLPATGRELDVITDVWRRVGAGRDLSGGPAAQVEVLTGARASETEFRARSRGRRVIHMATHGFFVSGECLEAHEDSRGIGGMVSPSVAGTPTSRPPPNPLRLSGLALAGANRRAEVAPDHDDGILTAEEIASMDLTGVEWAVLSACETGLGEFRSGEGVMGFRRSFHIAGARTTLMSLWRVRDHDAAEWMRALYVAHWQRALDTAESVRAASLEVLRARRAAGLDGHPAHWGAFIAVGDWR